MRTRSQVNTYRALEAQHRRDAAAFSAAIAASRAASAPPSDAPRADALNAPSHASSSPVEATPSTADAAFITPEKKTRKRKLCLSNATSTVSTASPPATTTTAASLPLPAEISPAARDAKRRIVAPTTTTSNSPKPSNTPAKVTAIRRTLDYADAEQRSAREVLERVAAGGSATDTNADADASHVLYVGRAEERLEIERVFAAGASDDPTRALFVIGPPGTGKSSCVAHVAARHAARTTVVRVNCSTFATPAALLDAVHAQFVKHGVTPRARPLPALDDAQQLDAFLAAALHAPSDCVLVLDEVDHLVRLPSAAMQRGAQRLLAFFVRWAHLPHAGLRFVGILNGVDMHAQIAAFLAHDPNTTRVVLFPAYALDELVAILEAVVRAAAGGGSDVDGAVEPRALELIARKVAARDGDARRAVGLLRQCARACLAAAASTPEAETPTGASSSSPLKLRVRDVLKCASAAIASQLSVAKQIQQLPRAPKVLLFGVTRLAACRKTASATLQGVVDELAMLRDTQPSLAWLPRFRLEELQQHLGALECYALVKQTPAKSKSAWQTKLASSVPMDALARAFQDDELLAQLPTSTTTE